MLLPLLLLAADPETAVDAERAFAAAAQAKGQWTAFREFAAPDAIMFVPEPTNAQAWLKDREDPVKSVEWWPTASYVSCDGKLAVNTGGWKRPDGSVGYFTTVWQRQADGRWKWTLDHGDALKMRRPLSDKPKVTRASCAGRPFSMPLRIPQPGVREDGHRSTDGTLGYEWVVGTDGRRTLSVLLWDGKDLRSVLNDRVGWPAPK